MKLHGNAALSWNGRRFLVERVVVEGWTLRRPPRRPVSASAVRVSGWAATAWRASSACTIARRRRSGSPTAPRRSASRRSRGYGDCASPLLRSPRRWGWRFRPSRGSWPGSGWAGWAGSDSSRRSATNAPGRRAAPHRRQEARSHPRRRRLEGPRRPTALQPHLHRPGRQGAQHRRLGIRPHRRRRLQPPRLRRGHRQTRKQPRSSASSNALSPFYRRHGIHVERLLTDNGSGYRSTIHALACRALGLKHLRTRPYRPQTNGKAERFIRTLLQGWAYGAIYASSHQRTAALDGWLWHYNHQRRHSALGHQPPISRTNLLGSYI